jgi:signal peptidase
MTARESASRALVEEVVRSSGNVRLRVFGTSMVPFIFPGDVISIQRAHLDEISLGEIALFSQGGRLFAHRVVSRGCAGKMPCLITRGDRLAHNDPPVASSEFLGRVTSIERGNQQFKPAAVVRGWNQLILRVLRASDLATYAYLHVMSSLRDLFPGRADCRP